jgi:hypothetical protein
MPILLGTPWIDRYVESIRPQSRQIKLVEGGAVAIFNNHDKAAIVRVTEISYLAPFSETVVRCNTSRVGLSQIRVSPKRKDGIAVVTNGVIETSDGAVNLRVANFSKTERHAAKTLLPCFGFFCGEHKCGGTIFGDDCGDVATRN